MSKQLAEAYRDGKIVIIPTDTIYAVSCDLYNKKSIDIRCVNLLGKKPNKANLSLLCKDLTDLAAYCKPLSNPVFKLMKRVLAWAIHLYSDSHQRRCLNCFKTNKRTVGIRVPDSEIVHALVVELGQSNRVEFNSLRR